MGLEPYSKTVNGLPVPTGTTSCDRPGSQPGALPCRWRGPATPDCLMVGVAQLKIGVDDGTRTHDDRDHNPGLYQLSYAHHGFDVLYLSLAFWRARQDSNLQHLA